MLLESLKRREGFDAGRSHPVVLSDGQTWLLPKPWIAIHPVFRDGRPVDEWRCLTYGPELDALIERIKDSDDLVEQVTAGVALAALLLTRNYDLTDDELAEVLVYRAGDPASRAMLESVLDVVTGRTGPKA